MKPVCIQCGLEMTKIKAGVVVLNHFNQPPEPYQAFMADLYECPNCKHQVAAGFADHPFWEHWKAKPVPEGENTIKVL